ncbi:MAG: YkgJ family cysteine cluster protein [Bacillota bacterium]
MKIFENQKKKMHFSGLNRQTTVCDFLDAQAEYLAAEPLDCPVCSDNCCRRDWNLQLDIVFFNRLVRDQNQLTPRKIAEKFIRLNPLQRPVFKEFPCLFLQENGRCQIYKSRALTCRLYTCREESEEYSKLKNILILSLNIPLAVKYLSLKHDISIQKAATHFELAEPALLPIEATNYRIRISELIAAARGFLPPKSSNIFS